MNQAYKKNTVLQKNGKPLLQNPLSIKLISIQICFQLIKIQAHQLLS